MRCFVVDLATATMLRIGCADTCEFITLYTDGILKVSHARLAELFEGILKEDALIFMRDKKQVSDLYKFLIKEGIVTKELARVIGESEIIAANTTIEEAVFNLRNSFAISFSALFALHTGNKSLIDVQLGKGDAILYHTQEKFKATFLNKEMQ